MQRAPTRHCSRTPRQTVVCRDRCIQQVEYVVMGCGIVGLSCARHLLSTQKNARVTVLEKSAEMLAPSSKTATGAGQGYIWQAHRDHTHKPAWKLASRGMALWREELAACAASSDQEPGGSGIGSNMHGSLLLSNHSQGAAELQRRAEVLNGLGISSEWLSPKACMSIESLVHVDSEGAGLRVTSDFQIDAASACKWLVERCEELGGQKSRFSIKFGVQVNDISMDCRGRVAAIETSIGCFRAVHGAVVAMGAATGHFISDSFGDKMYSELLHKRWGLLLRLPYPQYLPQGSQPLQHGVMESSYTQHYSQERDTTSSSSDAGLPAGVSDVTFTACTAADGQLLLGSSRHEGESSGEVDEEAVVDAIIQEACEYMPKLARYLKASRDNMSYRWGARPASRRGLPYISAVHGCKGLVVAAGHEGSGLTMALSTAEIVSALLTGSDLPEYADEFAV